MATAGKILMFPVGNWTSGNNYGFLDIVYYGGSSYIAKTDITNSTTNPATDTTNWQILAHGYIADTLSGIDGIDTSGLLGTVGATVTGQALLDEIADRVATKLVLKTAISNQQVNDVSKVPSSALVYPMNQTLSTLSVDAYWKRINMSAAQGSATVTIPAGAKEIRVCITYTDQLWSKDIQTSLLTGTSQIVGIGGNYYSSTDYCTISANISTTSVQMRLVWINGVQQRDSSYMVVFYK